ncbi:YesL family protein [Lederbergia graminis]|uniref:YesL family protein n=1 Tax=Lederbergia graminis TaxID=735518 RepID=A0ABW0LHB7_9BACI
MESSTLIGRLYIVSEWIVRFTLSNILWILFNLPIAYLAFNSIVINTPEQLIVNFVIIALLSPFLFFPSTTALFAVVRKWIIGELDISLIKSFIKFYKENYKKSMFGGMIFVPLWGILLFDYYYFSTLNSPLLYVFLLVSMFMLVFTTNFFCNLVHYHLSFLYVLKNSFLLSVGKPLQTIGITLGFIILVYVSFNLFSPLILLGLGSLIAFLSFYLYYKGVEQEQVHEDS